jgi:hypothetical protein
MSEELTATARELSIPSPSEVEEMEHKVRFYETCQGTGVAFYEYGDPQGWPRALHLI